MHKFRDAKVSVVQVHWLCPKDCGGEMLFAGTGSTNTFEPKWLHRCDKCGHLEDESQVYPKIEHR
jgi:hypothetical protein